MRFEAFSIGSASSKASLRSGRQKVFVIKVIAQVSFGTWAFSRGLKKYLYLKEWRYAAFASTLMDEAMVLSF